MTLEHESYYESIMASKGRSASVCTANSSAMDSVCAGRFAHLQEIGQTSRESQTPVSASSAASAARNPHRAAAAAKHTAAHRSQSARVIGANKPRVKKRERGLCDYQNHLDLASSEGVLANSTSESVGNCQESYNPFLRKVPSTGKLRGSNSLEMSNHSLHGTPPPQGVPHGHGSGHGHGHQHQQHHGTPPAQSQGTPRNSPKMNRRAGDRRGSDQVRAADKEKKSAIPIIATPEDSPLLQNRRPSSNKPTGLPKSPQVTRANTARAGSHGQGHSHGHGHGHKNENHHPQKSASTHQANMLDVPDPGGCPDDDDEESYRLRSFNITSKGIVNRGDSFRRRRSRSNSLIPSPSTTPEVPRNETLVSDDGLLLPSNVHPGQRSPLPSPKGPRGSLPANAFRNSRQLVRQPSEHPASEYRVALIGSRGVGKSSIVSQFMTSEGINAYDRQNDVEGEETVSVMLNGEESDLTFFEMHNPKGEMDRNNAPDAFLLVYSVVERSTFQRLEAELRRLDEWDLIQSKAIVVVGNKIDLARSRAVSTQDGRCLAVSFRVKFTEISVGINHNVDELLVGLLHQIRLKQAQTGTQDIWSKHRGIFRASVKARQMLTWVFGKEDSKFRNCENLHIL